MFRDFVVFGFQVNLIIDVVMWVIVGCAGYRGNVLLPPSSHLL